MRGQFAGEITVADDVLFGPNVTMFAHNQYYAVEGCTLQSTESEKIYGVISVGGHAWVGANVTVVAGVDIAVGAVIAAGSVVTKSTAPYTLYGGNPSKALALVFNDSCLINHLLALSVSDDDARNMVSIRQRELGSKSTELRVVDQKINGSS